ncbi:MAG: aminotransferase class I/II-fold pyridoxal phosphate-dependent enzyme [Candidatus Dadabacteria bacterium]|nr:MAG: aminotransferase class I/II-fold pyridoxal phosphate-dependent enzyme [Candidatus Dadabacteria bacterium]
MSLLAERMFAIDTENAFKVGPHIASIEAQGHDVVKLNLGEPDFNVPEFIKEEVKRQLDANNTHYCDPKGILPLRNAIARQVSETREIDVSPEQVVVFPGGKPSIGFTQEMYCNPGDEIIYPSPGFPIYESFIRYVGGVPVPLHLDEEKGFSFTGDQLAELITNKTKMIFLNFPSNPTGGVATKEQLEGIAKVILERCSDDVRVYSDEIYEYIIFDGKSHLSIASIDGMAERTIISSGFSKTFAWTGGRLGYAVFPTVEEADVCKNLNINYFSCVPPYNQEGAREAYENPKAKEAIAEMVSIFQERRDVIVEMLNRIDGITCLKPGGAFYLFPNVSGVCEKIGAIKLYDELPEDIKPHTSPTTLFQMFALYRHHVAVMDRKSFGRIGSEGRHYLRLSCASALETLKEGVRRLEAASEDISGFESFVREGKALY